MELKEVQKQELQMLEDFAQYCDKFNLRYYLAGGTLLGAVRHHGFIPWDDDIDVIMPRPDFEKFLGLVYTGNMDNYKIVDDYHDHADGKPFAKLENPEVVVNYKVFKEPQRLWIDIFPMDGMPSEIHQVKKHIKRIKHLSWCMWQASCKQQQIQNPIIKALKLILFIWFWKKGPLYYSRKITQCAKKYPYEFSEYVGCAVGKYGESERIKKANFEERIAIEFEEKYFCASKGFDIYLKNLYGNYMEIPNEVMRKTHLC